MAELLQRTGEVIRANPAVDTLIVNANDSNSGCLFMSLKPRNQRPPIDKVVEGLRKEVRAIPGVTVFINPIQNLRLGGRISKSRYQFVMRSVRAPSARFTSAPKAATAVGPWCRSPAWPASNAASGRSPSTMPGSSKP